MKPVKLDSKCSQCKKQYTKPRVETGCPKCAPGTIITEVEFSRPINYKRK